MIEKINLIIERLNVRKNEAEISICEIKKQQAELVGGNCEVQ